MKLMFYVTRFHSTTVTAFYGSPKSPKSSIRQKIVRQKVPKLCNVWFYFNQKNVTKMLKRIVRKKSEK